MRFAQYAGLLAALTLPLVARSARGDEWQPAKTRAVIVGVLEWKSGLTPYSKRHRKDEELRDVLVARGTPAENIELLLDKDATLPKIRETIARTARNAEKDCTLIVYYAGHGWPAGDDFCFANYEVNPSNKDTAWSLHELSATLAKDFHGRRAFFFADCCFSGGLETVVDALAAKKIPAFSLTSASTANTSTNNWTFTQSIIDGLRGEPLVDFNGDGKITLAELRAEVREAMTIMEGQKCGYKANGLPDNFVLAAASGRPKAAAAKFPIGSYVRAKGRTGRIVAVNGDRYAVQFYNYSDKSVEKLAVDDLTAVNLNSLVATHAPTPTQKPDCQVEWQGTWFDATILRKDKDRWQIHYLGYDDSWDEWVGPERIRFLK